MTSPVTFSVCYDFRNPAQWRRPWEELYLELLDQIAWIDADVPAISSVFVTEHHFFDDGYMPAAMVTCAAIAARTKRVTLGTNVLALPLYQPVHVAEEALVLDVLSGGRFLLGVGAGYLDLEFEALGRCSISGRAASRRAWQ